ncbi:MAG: DMT family transporter [Micavibrio sp.]|nr:DMT family transporter [Micavibrio sp.]
MLSAFSPNVRGIISAFIGFMCFACADTSAKWLGAHYKTFDIIFWSYLICLVFGLLISPWLGGLKKTLATRRLLIHIGRGVCGLGIAGCVIQAMSMGLPQANMYTILFLAPFMISLAAWPVFKEPVPIRNWGIIALGFAGIVIALRPGLRAVSEEELYAFAALGFIVGLSLLARPLDERESLHSLSFYPALTIMALVAPFTLGDIEIPSAEHLHVFILNGIFVTAGLSGIAYGFRIAPYSVIAPIHYIQMVIAIAAGLIFFGDVPDIWTISGAGVIIFSGLLLVWSNKRKRKIIDPTSGF